MAFTQLEAYLRELKESDDPKRVIDDIEKCLRDQMSVEEQGVCLSLMLGPKPTAFLAQLRDLINDLDKDRVRADMLSLLLGYADYLGTSLKPYAATLQTVCWRVMKTDKPHVKAKAFELFNIIEGLKLLPQDCVGVPDYQPPRFYIESLFKELRTSKSKLGVTVRGLIFETLGLLAELHPNDFQEEELQKLANLFTRTLEEEFASQDPKRKLIAHTLTGLRYFLNDFSHLFPMSARQKVDRIDFIFQCLKMSLLVTDDETRYDVPRAGFDLLTRHAALFKNFLTEHSEEVLQLIMKAQNHQNPELRTKSTWAFDAFMIQVCEHIVAHQGTREKNLFHFLLRLFVIKLDNNLSVDEISLAVCAFGHLAPAIVVYMDQQELSKFLHKLLRVSQRIYTGTMDVVEGAIKQFPAFLSAYASILKELSKENIDSYVISQLSQMMGPFFLVFPNMLTSVRKKHYPALIRIFIVLHSKGVIFRQFIDKVVWSGLTVTISALPETQTAQYYGVQPEQERLGYIQYTYLWHALLGISTETSEEKLAYIWNKGLNFPLSLYEDMQRVLYDQLVAHILKMLHTLELDLKLVDRGGLEGEHTPLDSQDPFSEDQESVSSLPPMTLTTDLSSQLIPVRPKDYQLYLNLVEFFRRFFQPPQEATAKQPLTSKRSRRQKKGKVSPELIAPVFSPSTGVHPPTVLLEWFRPWVLVFGKDMISLSDRHPLVSGFYKMMAIVFDICERQELFTELDALTTAAGLGGVVIKVEPSLGATASKGTISESAASSSVVGVEPETEGESESKSKNKEESLDNRLFIREMFKQFLGEVISRLQQFTNELLFSAISMVLRAPLELAPISALLPALEKAFKIGLNYKPAANLAMDALEKWSSSMTDLEPMLPVVLPKLAPYLYSPQVSGSASAITDDDEAMEDDDTKPPSRSGPSDKSGGKPAVETAKDVEHVQLAQRILLFLGRVAGANRALVNGQSLLESSDQSSNNDQEAMAWDTTSHVKYALPFPSHKLDVYLDPFLPRLTYLAEHSSNRKAKIAACEALHAIVTYMIAVGARDPNRPSQAAGAVPENVFDPSALYRRIFPSMLRLAVDVEQVTKQLYEPLVRQLIHWLTSAQQKENRETMALLDAITDGVASPSDGALREFCAECLAEFLKWSLKHVSSDKDPVNVKSLLRRLYSLAHHPNAFKRLGAALAFNDMYRIFREDSTLVSIYTLDILHNVLQSLSLADRDEDSLGTKEETRKVLRNMERIVIDPGPKKHHVLAKRKQGRAGAACCETLGDFTTWLFSNVGRREEVFRRECRHLFEAFAPLTIESGSTRDWIADYIAKNSLTSLVRVFENSTGSGSGPPLWLGSTPEARRLRMELSEDIKCEQVSGWLSGLGSALDCYYWFFDRKFIDPVQLLLPSEATKDPSTLLKDVRMFLSTIANSTNNESWQRATAYANYQRLKCTAAIRLFRLMRSTLRGWGGPSFQQVFVSVLNEDFFKLIFSSLLTPASTGYSMSDSKRIYLLQEVVGAVCKSLVQAPIDQLLMQRVLREVLAQEKVQPAAFKAGLLMNDTGFSAYLINGYLELWGSGLLEPVLGAETCKAFARDLASEAFNLVEQVGVQAKTLARYKAPQPDTPYRVLSPLHKHVGQQILHLALHIGLPDKSLFDYLSDRTPVIERSVKEETIKSEGKSKEEKAEEGGSQLSPPVTGDITRGEEFYTNFRSILDSFLMHKFSRYSKALLRFMFTSQEVATIVLNLAEFAIRARERLKKRGPMVQHNEKNAKEFSYMSSLTEFVPEALRHLQSQFTHVRTKVKPHSGAVMDSKSVFDVSNELELLVMTMGFIEKLLVLDQSKVLNLEQPSYKFVVDVYFQCMSREAPVSLKKTAIACLPYFVNGGEPTAGKTLQCVQRMVTYPPFPTRSADLSEGSVEWHEYLLLLEPLLRSIVTSRSFSLIEKLLGLLRERNHKCADLIADSVSAFIAAVNQPGRAEDISQIVARCIELFMNKGLDLNPIDNARRWVVENVCRPLLQKGPLSVVKGFFMAHGQALWQLIQEKPNGPNITGGVDDQRLEILELESAYSLLEIMFKRLDTTDLADTKVDHKEVMKMAHAHVKKVGTLAKSKVSFLDFRCAAYNCLCAALIKTQAQAQKDSSKFFDILCFSEKPAEDQYLWENIVDLETNLTFTILTNFKEVEAAVLKEINTRAATKQRVEKRTKRYLSSQYLSDSSLSQDVSSMQAFLEKDTETFVRDTSKASESETKEMKDKEGKEKDGKDEKDEKGSKEESAGDEVANLLASEVVDLDPVNNNPCMGTILELIDHIYKHFSPRWGLSAMPQFMALMHQKMNDSKTHINIRWFIARVVINRWAVFERYAQFWFRPLSNLALSPDNGGIGFHYALRDICFLFLRWTDFVPSDSSVDRELASAFMSHLFQQCSDYGQSDFDTKWFRIRANLRLVKLLVEKWRARLKPDQRTILDLLSVDLRADDVKVYVGLQLLGICTVNDFPPYIEDPRVEENGFIEKMMELIRCSRKGVYQPAAEVFGMILRAQYEDLSGDRLSTKAKYLKALRSNLKQLFKQNEFERYLNILQKIGLNVHSHHFFDSKLMNFVFSIPVTTRSEYMHKTLQLIFWGAPDIVDVFLKIRPLISRVLQGKDYRSQELLLMTIHRILSELNLNDLRELLPELVKVFLKHPQERCRALLHKILIWIHDNHDGFKQERSSRAESDEVKTVVGALLAGLSDESADISKTLFSFWDNESRLSNELAERLLSCLTTLYVPGAEQDWLRYSSCLLLNPLHRSTDYHRPISDTPLAECKFEEMQVNSQYTGGSLPFTPLFSIGSQGIRLKSRGPGDPPSEEGEEKDFEERQQGYIRATVANEFTLTQSQSVMSMDMDQLFNFNLQQQLAQSRNILFRPLSQGASQEGSLAEFNNAAQRKLKSRKRGAQRGGIKRATMNDLVERRFLAREDSQNKHAKTAAVMNIMRQHDMQKRYQEVWRARRREELAQSVTMYRKYRQGELPDIQIHHRELLLPLQALHSDPAIAKQLFITVFAAVYHNLDKMHSPAKAQFLRGKIGEALAYLMSLPSQDPSSSLVFCLHQATLECGKFNAEFTHCFTEGAIVTIGNNAYHSKNFHSGVLLLEHMLAHPLTATITPSGKKRRGEVSSSEGAEARDQEVWFQLAKLYRELGEDDVVQSLYETNANCEQTKRAIEATMKGDFAKAMMLYDEALDYQNEGKPWDKPPSVKEIDFWDDERLECCRALTDWDSLYLNVLENFDKSQEELEAKIWTSNEMYLRHYVASCSKLNKQRDNLYRLFERGLSQPETRKLLESTYTKELALVHAQYGSTALAQHYLNLASMRFLELWANLPPLAKGPRLRALQDLQQLTEVHEFLYAHPDTNPYALGAVQKERDAPKHWDAISGHIMSVASEWSERMPSSLDEVQVWDNVVANRAFFLQQLDRGIRARLEALEVSFGKRDHHRREVLDGLHSRITQTAVSGYQRASLTMARAGNHPVAAAYIKKALSLGETESKAENDSLLLRLTGLKVELLRISGEEDDDERAKGYWSLRDKVLDLDDKFTDLFGENVDPFLMYKLNKVSGRLHTFLADMLTADFHRFSALGHDTSSAEEVYKDAEDVLLEAANVFSGLCKDPRSTLASKHNTAKIKKTAASASMAYANFCDKRLRAAEDASLEKSEVPEDVGAKWVYSFVINVLQAMLLNSSEALIQFPRVLELTAKCQQGTKTRLVFRRYTMEGDASSNRDLIPAWMFLKWTPQMLAALGGPEGELVFPILGRIARQYPQALYFPFNLSRESLETIGTLRREAREYIDALGAMLHMPLLETFVEALDGLTNPEHKHKDMTGEVMKELVRKDSPGAVKAYMSFVNECLLGTRPRVGAEVGELNKRFAKQYKSVFDRNFGENGELLVGMKPARFQSISKTIQDTFAPIQAGKTRLDKYSQWLANFERHSKNTEEYIELPGQYTGDHCPQPALHIRIVNLDPTINIMSSIRRPKAVIIHGNDERDHRLLVKGGEDLRMDQRIEQLFVAMNTVFAADSACAKRGLLVRTYNVVPLTGRVGLIEWVPETVPLKTVITDQAKDRGCPKPQAVVQDYLKWVGENCGIKNENRAPMQFVGVLNHVPTDVVVKSFAELESRLPADLLKSGLAKLCASPEAFITVRSRFAASFAAFSIASYVLGIGDRHLDNVLLDKTNGTLVGIDFGAAFGQGLLLGVPELMPFRFTRQFQRLLHPLDTKGLMSRDMVNCMTALQGGKQYLMTIMEVFVKEPQLDWVAAAKSTRKEQVRTAGAAEDEDTQDSILWYPQEKVRIAWRKLTKHNPAAVMLDEFKRSNLSTRNPEVYAKCLTYITGAPRGSLRSKRGLKVCETVKEQIDCLVDQATDPNILGRSWAGWMPFV